MAKVLQREGFWAGGRADRQTGRQAGRQGDRSRVNQKKKASGPPTPHLNLRPSRPVPRRRPPSAERANEMWKHVPPLNSPASVTVSPSLSLSSTPPPRYERCRARRGSNGLVRGRQGVFYSRGEPPYSHFAAAAPEQDCYYILMTHFVIRCHLVIPRLYDSPYGTPIHAGS